MIWSYPKALPDILITFPSDLSNAALFIATGPIPGSSCRPSAYLPLPIALAAPRSSSMKPPFIMLSTAQAGRGSPSSSQTTSRQGGLSTEVSLVGCQTASTALCLSLPKALMQFLMMWKPPTIKLFLLLLYNYNFATFTNYNANTCVFWQS